MIVLVPGTVAMFDAELTGDRSALAALLGVSPINEWPPIGGEHDHDAVTFFRTTMLSDPTTTGWLAYYVVRDDELVGSAGFFGPPNDGLVEIGYSVCLGVRRQRIATQAVRVLIEQAQSAQVARMQAHVRPDNGPSIRVLASCGFTPTTSDDPDQLLFALTLSP
jgi:[ribosomal protein S5]-alanine N-acetyltransferase